jgi:hypothetical protein
MIPGWCRLTHAGGLRAAIRAPRVGWLSRPEVPWPRGGHAEDHRGPPGRSTWEFACRARLPDHLGGDRDTGDPRWFLDSGKHQVPGRVLCRRVSPPSKQTHRIVPSSAGNRQTPPVHSRDGELNTRPTRSGPTSTRVISPDTPGRAAEDH